MHPPADRAPAAAPVSDTSAPAAEKADWLVGGGEMAKVIKTKDWSQTALGPIESWPQSLRTVVSLMQASNSPISLVWGPGHVQIYNDGYWPICGDKHPTSMGQDFRECWAAPWPVISGAYETALAGKTSYLEKMRMFLERYGFLEETWFTFSFSPITDESGKVGGLFHPVTELTSQMLSERRNRTLGELAIRAGKAKTTPDAFAVSTQVLAESDLDLPFVLFYLIEPEGRIARRAAQTGLGSSDRVSPPQVDLQEPGAGPWAIAEAARSGRVQEIHDVAALLAGLSVGPYPELPRAAFALPIMAPGQERPAAVMVAGASPRLPMNEPYRTFYDLVAAGVSTALANARAYEEERRKAEALAELDRAKTAFFSNVSHEFRTPLTLMLAPLEDELNEREQPLPAPRLQRIETVHRNSLRLLKLVNTLLDFSRLEAGRTQALYRPTDLAVLTADLASSFRSAVERGGLTLTVDCPPLPQPIYVDREMWEKIVLNLLSNAFKHTFAGGITVGLLWLGDGAELSVQDTGVGIPQGELPKLFQRFHRVHGAASRTNEGTGIGLSLVAELVKLHQGSIHIESEERLGSRFRVRLPAGRAHLPAERVGSDASPAAVGSGATAYVQEALHWLPDGAPTPEADAPAGVPAAARPRVLWADDNADMRQYVARLLGGAYDVVAVTDGEAALRAARAAPPDLILSDVMMPKLDGFGLLKALRETEATRLVPVILLSARAGEEAALDGLAAGADDYLVKPFSAKELLARVRSCLTLAQLRKESAAKLEVANRALARAVQAKAEFLANMSHEIRTPMNAVIGMTSLLLSTEQTPEQRDYTETIRASGDHLLTVINEILDFSKLEAGRLALENLRFELRQCLEEAIDVVAQRASEKGLDLAYFIAPDVPRAFLGDAGRVRQILINLLGNAVKFTLRGEVVVSVERRALGDAKQELHVSVRDTGIGIPEERMDRLFQAFSQVDASISRHFGGSGLGLAISQKLAAALGGRLWAQSEPGKGSTFHFTMVADAVLDDEAPPRPPIGQPGLRVLVADDNITHLQIVEAYLKSWGMTAVCVERPQQALELLLRGEFFDLAIIDYMMPDMNGFALGVELRKTPRGRQLPMVLMSAVHFARPELSQREPHFAAVATKPIRPSTLQNAIAEALFSSKAPVAAERKARVLDAELGKRSPLRILIVEDNPVNQKVAILLLSKMGYTADTAGNGIEALQAINRQIYDLVFMDVQMPEMDGLAATREVCARWPLVARPRIVGMTANATEEDRKECFEAGMDDYIAKPVTVPMLERTLRDCPRRSA
jgi:signal transduction histidine kinase